MPQFPNEYTEKTTPVGADNVLIADSASSNAIKRLTLTNLKVWLQSLLLWVTTAMINDLAVTTGKMADGAATPAKRSGGFATGQFSLTASTGNQSVTGLGFTPKYVEFYWAAGEGTGAGSNTSRGMGNGRATATDQSCEYFYVRTGVPTMFSDRKTTLVLHDINYNTGSASWVDRQIVSFVSMDADGFTVNKTTANSTLSVEYTAYA